MNSGIPVNWSEQYFTIEALEDGLTVKMTLNTLYYSIDDGASWNRLSASTETPAINTGQKILFKRDSPYISTSSGIGTFEISKRHNVGGNIMSLLYGDDFEDQLSLSGKNYAFYKLFYGCSGLVDASNLILPATTLANCCYEYMFNGCTSLVSTPALPATTLADNCYSSMFMGCTSLVSTPALPATTLASYCYSSMFFGCKSLVSASELPATTLAENCYNHMFYGCSSLTTAPELPATTLASYCYSNMFGGCTKLSYIKMLATNISSIGCLLYWLKNVSSAGTFIKHPSMTTLPSGADGIPKGWTVIDNV